ncbi:MAG: peptidylprolyl isomerase [Candidatus Zixiibacteriota bacterium]
MLSSFRKLTKVVIWVVIVAFVGTIILVWGADITSSKAQKNIIGTIAGRDIDFGLYRPFLDRLYQQEQQKLGDQDMDATMINNLRRQAWDNFVADYLMNQELDKRNVTITNKEMYQYLKYNPPQEFRENPEFQTNGQFDYNKYLGTMANEQATYYWKQVENYYRPELAKAKLQQLIASTVRVGEQDIQEYYMDTQEKVKVEYINVSTAKYINPAPEVSEDQVLDYYNSHKDDYKVEDRASVDYVEFSKEPTDEDWDYIMKEADDVKALIDDGEDFAEMAISYSEGPSAPQGGDLGWFKKGQMVTEFDSAAFAMKVGEVSEPVKTKFGWHIIKLEDKRKKDGQDELKARHILFKIKASENTLSKAFTKAQEFLNNAESDGFDAAAEMDSLEVKNTGLFTENQSIPQLGNMRGVNNFAFQHDIGDISHTYENSSAMFVVRVAEKAKAGIATLDEIRDRVTADARRKLIMDICLGQADKVYDQVKDGANFESAAKEADCSYDKTDFFARNGFIKGIGRDPQPLGAAFSLKNPGDITKPVEYSRGYVIFKLLERQSADLTTYATVKDSIQQVLFQQRANEVLNAWYVELIKDAHVEDYIDEFFTVR